MTVALAGDGGDELFAGYAPFQGLGIAAWMRHVPSAMIAGARSLAQLLPASDGYLGLQFKALAFLQGFPAPDGVRFPLWLSALSPCEYAQLCSSGGREKSPSAGALFAEVEEVLAPLRGRSLQQNLLYYYQKMFLPEFVCMHTDRGAMQSSLEVRSPFLSLPLIEFANRLPDRHKMNGHTLKLLLRRVAARRGLSSEIVRQRKQGFTFPVARWLKTVLREQAEALLKPEDGEEQLMDFAVIKQHFNDHMAARRNNYRLLYHLIVFRAWRRNYPALKFA
jgi:asparagine synthase (glutamine-hydrolysing)